MDTQYLEVWQSQIPPCFSRVSRISSLLSNRAVDYKNKKSLSKQSKTQEILRKVYFCFQTHKIIYMSLTI